MSGARRARAIRRASSLLVLAWMALAALVLAPSSASAQNPAQGVDIRADVQYESIGGTALTMDAYLPQGTGPFPALIAIHGGGFVGGDKSLMRGVSIYFAQNGYAVFSIDYRLAPEFPYPAAVQDAQAAVTFVRDHAQEYKVDPGRVGVIGGSAGGTIAVSLGAASKGHLASGSGVAAVVSWSGALDLAGVLSDRSGREGVATAVLSYAGVQGADPNSAEAQTKLEAASPSAQVAKGDPPMFIANAITELMPLPQAQAFVDKLTQLGVPHEFLNPPQGHALRYAGQAEPPTLSFLNKYLRDFKGGGSTTPPPTTPSTEPPSSLPPASPASKSGPLLIGIVMGGLVLIAAMLLQPKIATMRRRRRSRY